MIDQLSVYAENTRGAMLKVSKAISDSGIDILNVVTNDSAEFGIIRMVVSHPEKAVRALSAEGYLCRLTDVIGIEVCDEVGNLNKLLRALEDSNIDVNYLYLSFNRDSGKPIMVFHAEDCYEVEECLVSKGFTAI